MIAKFVGRKKLFLITFNFCAWKKCMKHDSTSDYLTLKSLKFRHINIIQAFVPFFNAMKLMCLIFTHMWHLKFHISKTCVSEIQTF